MGGGSGGGQGGGVRNHLLVLLSPHGTTLPTDSRYVDYRGSGGGGTQQGKCQNKN